jgi:hypothetical protein
MKKDKIGRANKHTPPPEVMKTNSSLSDCILCSTDSEAMSEQVGRMTPAISGKVHSMNLRKVDKAISLEIMRDMCRIETVSHTMAITIGDITNRSEKNFRKR